MKRLFRSFLFLGVLVGAMALGQLIAEAAVTINKAECKQTTNCNDCKYRIEGNRCRSHRCDNFPTTHAICIFVNNADKTCDGTQAPGLTCFDCAFSTCGLIAGGKCDGCACPAMEGNIIVAGWATC